MVSNDLTISEVATDTRHSRSAVECWIKKGVAVGGSRVRLAARRVGGRLFVPRDALAAFLAAINPEPVPAPETPAAATRRARRDQDAARQLLTRGKR